MGCFNLEKLFRRICHSLKMISLNVSGVYLGTLEQQQCQYSHYEQLFLYTSTQNSFIIRFTFHFQHYRFSLIVPLLADSFIIIYFCKIAHHRFIIRRQGSNTTYVLLSVTNQQRTSKAVICYTVLCDLKSQQQRMYFLQLLIVNKLC